MDMSDGEIATAVSQYNYADTIDRLSLAIRKAGFTIFTEIDQAAAAASAGLSLRPTTLLIFGNPKAGTLLMQMNPSIGIDLPLKFLVWEESGDVKVGYVPAATIARRYLIDSNNTIIAGMDVAIQSLIAQLKKVA